MTEFRNLGPLSRPDEFIKIPQSLAPSGPVTETSRILSRKSQGRKEESSENDLPREMRVPLSHSSQELGPKNDFYNIGDNL